MRIVLDTNVLVSALIGRGPSSRLIEAHDGGLFELVPSAELVAEFDAASNRPDIIERIVFGQRSTQPALAALVSCAALVQPGHVPMDTVRDVKDVIVLACAIGGRADIIVTGNKDLLVLREYEGIAIMSPLDCLRTLGLE